MKKIIIALLCALVIMLSGCAPSQPAEPDVPQKDYSEDWRSRPIPEAFDLRNVDTDGDGEGDRCYVTPIRFQNPFGTCWGFAAIAAAETSILGNNLKDDKDAWKTLDLSEKQLAYFTNVPLNEPDNPQNGEGFTPTNINDSNEVYGKGGTCYLATSTFAQGIGPSYENDEKYNDYFTYRGRNHYADIAFIDGEFRNFSYAAEDDWTIPDEYRFTKDFSLSYSHIIPSPAERNYAGEYVYNAYATQLIKEELLDKRGVLVGFCADASRPSQDVTQGVYIELNNWAHYTWNPTVQANHAVTIIGWDDNYPKENFISEHMPPENGAWLVKNSWGSGEEEFPASGNRHWGIEVPDVDENGNPVLDENGNPVMVGSGYFWLSYYDMSLIAPESFVFETADPEEHIYQHDYLSASDFSFVQFAGPVSMANVFTSAHAEVMNTISCVTALEKTSVDYSIYILPESFETPDQGCLVASGSEVFEFSGFHKIPLMDEIDLQAGQKYSVVLSMTTNDNIHYINLPTGVTATGLMDQRTVINPRESFVNDNGAWMDYKDLAEGDWASKEDPYALIKVTTNFDNFPIKTYTHYKEGNMNILLVAEKTNLSLKANANHTTISCRFRGTDEINVGNPEIKWTLLPGSEDVVDMEVAPEGRSVTLTAKKFGKAMVAATVDGIGTEISVIEVKLLVPKIYMPLATYLEYTGKPLTVSALVLSENNTIMIEGVDFTLKFTDNINCGIARMEICDVDGNSFDPIKVGFFGIRPKKAEITSVSNSAGTIEVTVADQWSSGISGYILEYRGSGSDSWIPVQFTEGNVLTVSGLAAGSYDVRVSAFVDTSSAEKEIYNQNMYYGDYSEVVNVEF